MKLTVLKSFKTRLRRFAIGDAVSEADDFSPLAAADLKCRRFIGEPAKDPAPKKVAGKPA